MGVLRELGDAVCLCTVPGRADHQPLLDVFIRARHDEPEWEDRRRTRVDGLGLTLSFHAQRPADLPGGRTVFRQSLLTRRFGDDSEWRPPSEERWNSWRAYQLRETAVLAIGSVWSSLLGVLDRLGPMSQSELRSELVETVDWASVGMSGELDVRAAIDRSSELIPDGEELIAQAVRLEDTPGTRASTIDGACRGGAVVGPQPGR